MAVSVLPMVSKNLATTFAFDGVLPKAQELNVTKNIAKIPKITIRIGFVSRATLLSSAFVKTLVSLII